MDWYGRVYIGTGKGVYREISFGDPGINGRMHLPQAYRSLPRPSSLIKPSHPPIGVFAPDSFASRICSSISF
jgi:hypothetical protein